MKKLSALLTGIGCLLLFNAKAQLAGTKWKGSVMTNEEHQVIWEFGKDTSRVFFPDNSEETEVMIYKVDSKKKQLSITKITGTSPCTVNDIGIYSYEITGDELKVTPVQDPCTGRSGAILSAPFKRVTS